MTFYQKTTLPGGLRVITETIPTVRSASVGIWVAAGSAWEEPANMGISHFLEHMFFKGTPRRSARQIAREIDGRGGNLNAFTAKENTCYYAKVLDEHLPLAVDVLADMLQNSLFDAAEMQKEKGVVIEEIKMYEDVPDDVVHDLFASTLYKGHPLGRPIVGTAETVQSFRREQLVGYVSQYYTAPNIVVAAAGNVQHLDVVLAVEREFRSLPAGEGPVRWPAVPARPAGSAALVRLKETEQAHVVVGVPGLCQDHEEIYALHLLNTVLGASTSSRLFQEIREERGLAYSVYSYQTCYKDAGDFAVYAGVSPGALAEVLELILQALDKVGREGINQEELAEAKEQLKGQIMLGLESTTGRMHRLGRGELTRGSVQSPDAITARIDAVTQDQVHLLAQRLLLGKEMVLSAVGPKLDKINFSGFGFSEVKYE